MSLVASCHCGATRIELPHIPDNVSDCNCTYCHRTGAVWAYFDPSEVKVEAAADAVYSPSSPLNEHHFCAKCGGNTHGSSPDWGSMYNLDGTLKEGMQDGIPEKRTFGVNLRMIIDLDLSSLKIEHLDGRNNW